MDNNLSFGETVLELTSGVGSIGYSNPLDAMSNTIAERDKNIAIDSATTNDKLSSMFEQAKKTNIAYGFLQDIQESGYSKIPEDIEFRKSFGLDSIDLVLQENKLPAEDGVYLSKSRSKKELDYRVLDKISQRMADEKIRNTLTEREMIGSSIAGAVVDAPTVLGFGIGATYGVGSSLAKITMIEGAFNAGLSAVMYVKNEDMSMGEAVTMTMAGTLLSVGATQLAKSIKGNKARAEIIDDAHVEMSIRDNGLEPNMDIKLIGYKPDVINMSYSEEYAQSLKAKAIDTHYTNTKRLSEIDNEIKAIDENILKREVLHESGQIPKSSDEEFALLSSKRASLMDEGNTIKGEMNSEAGIKARAEAELEDVITQERIKLNEEETFNRGRNEELAKKFESERYANYSENRKTFFNLQNEIHGHILEGKLTQINNIINETKNKIKEVQNKLFGATNKSVQTRFKNQLNNLTRELSTQKEELSVNINKKPLSPEKIKMMRAVDEMSEDIHNIVDELHGIVKLASKEELRELEEIVNAMKLKYPKEMENVSSLLKSKLNNKTVDELRATGKLPKAITLASILAVGGFAGEGGEDIKTEIVGTMFLIAGGVILYKNPQILNSITNPNIRQAFSSVGSRLKDSYKSATFRVSPEAGIIRRVGTYFSSEGKTRLTSTIAPFEKEGGAIHAIANKLLYSFKDGSSVSMIKTMWNNSSMAEFNAVENKFFKLWKSENKTLYGAGFWSDVNSKINFRQDVAFAMKNRDGIQSEVIKKAVLEYDKAFEKLYLRNKEYGTYGFDKLDYKAGMLPRFWKNTNMQRIMPLLSEEDRLKVRDMLKNAFAKNNGDFASAEEQANVFIDNWTKGSHGVKLKSSTEDIYGILSPHFKDDTKFEDIANALNTYSDRQARSKYRIEFDENDLSMGVKVNVNGVDEVIDLNSLIETDAKVIFDRTANQLNASASFAKYCWKSVAELDKEIANLKNVKDPVLTKELKQVKDLILGVPVENPSDHINQVMLALKDLTIAGKLPFVVTSMGSELINLLTASSLNKTLKAFCESMGNSFGKESEQMSQMARVSGVGNNIVNNDITFRGLTGAYDSLEDVDFIGSFRNGTIAFRKAMLYVNMLFGATDFIQKAGTAVNIEKLGRHLVLGDVSNSGINKIRMAMMGMKEEDLNAVKHIFKFDDKGKMLPIEWGKLTMREDDTVGEALMLMNQNISPETTLGETPLWAYTDPIGKAFSTLSMYPVQQFNVQGLGGMYAMDRTALMQSFGAFVGSYVGLHARYSLQNKKVDDEKILLYSIMSMPQLGGLSFITSMLNPPVLDTANSMASMIGMDKKR